MKKTMNDGWRFHLGNFEDAWKKSFVDRDWREVELPHDWSVEGEFSRRYSSGTGYLPGGTGWYRHTFALPENLKGKKIFLHFDGIYKNASVWCNSYYLGLRPNGYIGYSYDISDLVVYGESKNVISVKVEHEDLSDSRWFTGSGITRDVFLYVEEPLHFQENSLVFSTQSLTNEQAHIKVCGTVQNEQDEAVDTTVTHCLYDQDKMVWQSVSPLQLGPGERVTTTVVGVIDHPQLWSPQTPHLYTLRSYLGGDAASLSAQSTRVGLRIFKFDADHGFFVNGTKQILKGVCVHHDAGCLGAAVRKEVWLRRLTTLKEMGCNAIRMSHNPHMPALFDLCDALGFFAVDEAFDEWEGCKNKWSTGHNVYPPKYQGYAKDFPQWGEADLRALVRRDRNHPCVLLWSIGNEVDYPNDPYCHPLLRLATGNNDANKPAVERQYSPDKPNMERLRPIMIRLAEIVHEEDDTRPVTAALAFPEISSYIGCVEPLDVVGYNYKEHLYAQSHHRFPQKPFFGSENAQDYAAWQAVEKNEYIAGQFLWTGIDFLGEARGWPIHGSSAGLLTLAGFPKGEYWFRRSLWADKPVLTLLSARRGETDFERSWHYAQGQSVTVRCCTTLPQAELFLNGKSLGLQKRSAETGDIRWDTTYEKGLLTVRAGALSDQLSTTGLGVSLRMEAWNAPTAESVSALTQVEISLLDENGQETTGAELLHICTEGSARLLGIENGDLADNTAYCAPYRRTYRGKLLVYLVKKSEPGTALLSVYGENVGRHTIKL